MQDIQIMILLGEGLGIVILAILYIKSKLPGQTIQQQSQLISSLTQRVKDLEDGHHENEKVISDLQGQIKVYKELPLQEIATSLKVLEKLPQQFEEANKANNLKLLEALSGRKLTPNAA